MTDDAARRAMSSEPGMKVLRKYFTPEVIAEALRSTMDGRANLIGITAESVSVQQVPNPHLPLGITVTIMGASVSDIGSQLDDDAIDELLDYIGEDRCKEKFGLVEAEPSPS